MTSSIFLERNPTPETGGLETSVATAAASVIGLFGGIFFYHLT
jgi:hypothetical protein